MIAGFRVEVGKQFLTLGPGMTAKVKDELNDDGTVYAGNSETTQAKVLELLGTYPRGSVVVVHNVTLTLSLELSDVTE